MYILGISAFYHDSAAAIIKDGKIIVALEEERFSRIKHDNQFPHKAVENCLKYANISIGDIHAVSYYEKPLLKFERILTNYVETFPYSVKYFIEGTKSWLTEKIKVKQIINKKLGYNGKVYFIPHHLSHAASAFYTSPFKKAAVATIDGVGEYHTTALWAADEKNITLLKSLEYPNSLGLLYSTFTAFLGFRVNEDEYKVMGLSAYGIPKYVQKIYKIIDIKSDGSFKMDMHYFGFREGNKMWNNNFETLFGLPRRTNSLVTQRHKNLAASIQKVTEEIYFKLLNQLYIETNSSNLCIAGGVGLNALANGKIYTHTPFKKIHILGCAGDSGGAVGSALFTYYSILKKRRKTNAQSLNLGTKYSNNNIEEELLKHKVRFEKFNNTEKLIEKSAYLLSKNKVLGWFQGRMEFGPRALGNRSIFANPAPFSMKEKVNRIKIREQFRPFGGIVLQEKTHELFEVPEKNHHSPFMVFCFKVKNTWRSKISSIVHADGTCRIQTVNKSSTLTYRLVKKFYMLTGVPCILNTSFNLSGEPLVETPKQAIEDFLKSPMDYLVIGSYIVSKITRS